MKSEYGCAPMTGTESMNWYNFVERLAKSGKRLPNYAEFCAYAFGSPAGLDNANTNAWSATRVLRNTGKDLERDKTECLISYSQSGCPAARQREKIRLLVSSYGERQELNT